MKEFTGLRAVLLCLSITTIIGAVLLVASAPVQAEDQPLAVEEGEVESETSLAVLPTWLTSLSSNPASCQESEVTPFDAPVFNAESNWCEEHCPEICGEDNYVCLHPLFCVCL